MKQLILFLPAFLLSYGLFAQSSYQFAPRNPVDSAWLLSHLSADHPRLILPNDLAELRQKARQTGSLTALHFRYLRQNADSVLAAPLLKREKIGRRLLSVSREAVRRLGLLGLVYQISQDKRYARRLEEELLTVCQFIDWNPSHFLDVAEMAYAVAIGLDWGYEALSDRTKTTIREALVTKALQPGLIEKGNGWIRGDNNWSQVCHGGLSIAALMVAEEEPALAAEVVSRALMNLPLALETYHPDGAYPEGASYWFYATYYSAVTIAAFESALGTDFDLFQSPGFAESAQFSVLMAGPTGQYYDYFDAKAQGAFSVKHYDILSWFAQRDDRYAYVDTARYRSALHQEILDREKCHRFAPAGWVWLAEDQIPSPQPLPETKAYRGQNPLVVLRDSAAGTVGFYLGAKGGRASLSHGNMDVGSFIFELDSVRWSVDPGNQSYHPLEEIMGRALWSRSQYGRRWTLLTKNNYGHSTLTVNDSLHRVDGAAPMVRTALESPAPSVSFDLTQALGAVDRAVRTFTKVNDRTLRITDSLTTNDETQTVTWNLMTQADVTVTDDGATLEQAGKTLYLTVRQPANFDVRVIPLSPPPLPYDKDIEHLKRIEVRINPADVRAGPIEVALRGR